VFKKTTLFRSKIISRALEGLLYGKVLDIGCGDGIITNEISKHFKCSIISTDIVDQRELDIPFKLMKRRGELPFNDGEFDIAIFIHCLHHINDYNPLINEARRVAKNILIYDYEPTFMGVITDIICNLIHYKILLFPLPKSLKFWEKIINGRGKMVKITRWYPWKDFVVYNYDVGRDSLS
jgi:SAM-dependent methyltransferase